MHNAQLMAYKYRNCLRCFNLRQFAIKSNRIFLLLLLLYTMPIYGQEMSDMSDKSDSINSSFLNFCDKREQQNLFQLPSEAKITTEGSIPHSSLNRWDALMNWNFMALPYPSYSPETSWQFGITGVWYFHTTKNSTQFSDLNFDMGYTLNHQWYLNANSRIYFNTTNRWYLDAYLSAKHYPDLFFGTTNNIDSVYNPAIRYTSNFVDIQARPSFYITKHWLAGANIRLRYENSQLNTTETQTTQYCPPVLGGRAQRAEGVHNSKLSTPNSKLYNGFGENLFLGIGASIFYDTRSNNYYPLNGLFFKTTATYYHQIPLYNYPPKLGGREQSSEGVCSFLTPNSSFLIQLDLRHYIPLYKELILAWNFRSEIAVGNNVPFQLLPTIGGQDLVRGIRQNKFKDNTLFALQAELRIPIWRFLKAAVFGSIGDVYNYNNWQWATPKIGYGVGLRACIHQAKTNIRFDVARQNYSNDWSFYFTVKEAF